MNAPRSLALLAAGAALLAACDSVDAPRSPTAPGAARGTAAAAVGGVVFADADGNGVRGPTESGIPDVVVYLFDANAFCGPNTYCLTAQTTTDATGAYTFAVPDGAYGLFVPTTPNVPGFNARLFTYLAYTSGAFPSRLVTAGPDAAGHDFGFGFRIEATAAALNSGALPTRTLTPAGWADEIRRQTRGDPPQELPGFVLGLYLLRIEGLLLPEPFRFGAVSKPAAALALLEPPTPTPLDELLRQLLTAELNVVSGRGASEAAFNQALLAYGEATAANAAATAATGAPAAARSGGAGTIEEATYLLDVFNRSGGGSTGPR